MGSGAKGAGWGRRPQDTSPGSSLFRGEALSPLLLQQMVSQRPGPRREANTASSEFPVLKTIQLTVEEKGEFEGSAPAHRKWAPVCLLPALQEGGSLCSQRFPEHSRVCVHACVCVCVHACVGVA